MSLAACKKCRVATAVIGTVDKDNYLCGKCSETETARNVMYFTLDFCCTEQQQDRFLNVIYPEHATMGLDKIKAATALIDRTAQANQR